MHVCGLIVTTCVKETLMVQMVDIAKGILRFGYYIVCLTFWLLCIERKMRSDYANKRCRRTISIIQFGTKCSVSKTEASSLLYKYWFNWWCTEKTNNFLSVDGAFLIHDGRSWRTARSECVGGGADVFWHCVGLKTEDTTGSNGWAMQQSQWL